MRGEKLEPDDFRGEQALFFNVKGKGLVVISSCAHAGIVNTVKQAQKDAGTGFEAIVAFSKEMPDTFTLNTAGTKYTFGA